MILARQFQYINIHVLNSISDSCNTFCANKCFNLPANQRISFCKFVNYVIFQQYTFMTQDTQQNLSNNVSDGGILLTIKLKEGVFSLSKIPLIIRNS